MPFAGQPNPCSLNSKMCISVSSNLLPFNDSKSVGLCIQHGASCQSPWLNWKVAALSFVSHCHRSGSRSKTPSAG